MSFSMTHPRSLLILALLALPFTASAGTVTCTGQANQKLVKITHTFQDYTVLPEDGFDGNGRDTLTVQVGAEKVFHETYAPHVSSFYVSQFPLPGKEPLIVFQRMNDGTEPVVVVEYLGSNDARTRIRVPGGWLGIRTPMAVISNPVCKVKYEE